MTYHSNVKLHQGCDLHQVKSPFRSINHLSWGKGGSCPTDGDITTYQRLQQVGSKGRAGWGCLGVALEARGWLGVHGQSRRMCV